MDSDPQLASLCGASIKTQCVRVALDSVCGTAKRTGNPSLGVVLEHVVNNVKNILGIFDAGEQESLIWEVAALGHPRSVVVVIVPSKQVLHRLLRVAQTKNLKAARWKTCSPPDPEKNILLIGTDDTESITFARSV